LGRNLAAERDLWAHAPKRERHADGIELFVAVPPAAASSGGHKEKAGSRPLPDWYPSDRHRFDRADRQELDRPRRVRHRGVCRTQPQARAISSSVAQGVHIACLKQFSGHASLKSLEEYVALDELRHNHPLKDIL
jgi:hypothetical protein